MKVSHWIYLYISVHVARKDLTAHLGATFGWKKYPNWKELEEAAEMILDLTETDPKKS